MASEAARVLDYTGSAYYGSAAPARAPYPYVEPEVKPADIPVTREQPRTRQRAREAAVRRAPSVSLFAGFGTVFAGILMIFVVLAQINYNEITAEMVRLNTHLEGLMEQERRLEIEFESAIDMKKIEQYARDSLGMSKPDADQIAVIRGMPMDSAEIIDNSDEQGTLSSLGSFISSLLEYFR